MLNQEAATLGVGGCTQLSNIRGWCDPRPSQMGSLGQKRPSLGKAVRNAETRCGRAEMGWEERRSGEE